MEKKVWEKLRVEKGKMESRRTKKERVDEILCTLFNYTSVFQVFPIFLFM